MQGLLQGPFFTHGDVGVKSRVHFLDTVQEEPRQFHRRELALAEAPTNLCNRGKGEWVVSSFQKIFS